MSDSPGQPPVRGKARAWVFPLVLLGIAVIVTVFALGTDPQGDPEKETADSSDALNSVPSKSVPDIAVVVVRDLSGNFEDCMCTGLDAGGIPRLPAAAYGAKSIHYLFIGRLVMPPLGTLRPDILDEYGATADTAVAVLRDLFGKMGNVSWIPDATELADLASLGVSVGALEEWRAETAVEKPAVSIRIGQDGEVTVNGHPVPMVPANSRTRRVLVVAAWNPGSRDKPAFDHDAGFAYLNGQRDPHNMEVLADVLAGAKGRPLVSYWATNIHESMATDRSLLDMATRGRLGTSHGGKTQHPRDSHPPESLLVSHGDCNGCHPRAFAAWSASAHAHALATIERRGQDANPLCLNCHVTQVGKRTAEGFAISPRHAGVTCASCHSSGVPAKEKGRRAQDACVRCHTAESDPTGKFRAVVDTVCPGDVLSQFGGCRRE